MQLKFSFIFVGALFLILHTGAALFDLLNISLLKELLGKDWFYISTAVLGFGCALHLTDIRPAIVRGIRNLLLVLLSWLLPVAALLIGAFLLSLPLTGLQALWQTHHASKLLLGSCVLLLILINSAFQDSAALQTSPRILAWSCRFACTLILPLAALSSYALGLRVHDYGWSSDRVIAASCSFIALCYGLAYAYGACDIKSQLSKLAAVNTGIAYLTLMIIVSMFTPLLDPARIAVNDQIGRLYAGKVAADEFDYNYLRFEGGRYGKQALEQLSQEQQLDRAALIRQRASTALAQASRAPHAPKLDVKAEDRFKVWPAGRQLPASFLQQKLTIYSKEPGLYDRDYNCIIKKETACDAVMLDLNHDGKLEIIVFARDNLHLSSVYSEISEGVWQRRAELDGVLRACDQVLEAMKAGEIKAIRPEFDDLQIAGLTIHLKPLAQHWHAQCGK